MTCIVGLECEEGVVIGGDSAGVSGMDMTVRADEKVFRVGPFIMGFTSSFRMGQLLRYSLRVPDHYNDESDYQYMVTSFIDAVRECLEEGGWKKKKDERESGGSFLVGYRGRLYEVDSDFQVGMNVCGYAAVGCGHAYAMGSLYATDYQDKRPFAIHRVRRALEAAETFSAGVAGPFVIEGPYMEEESDG